MLDALKKKLGLPVVELAPATEAATFTLEELNEVIASNESLEAALAAANTELTALRATVEANAAALAEIEAAKNAAVADAKATKTAVRKAALVEAIGEAKADALLLATENLDDAAFDAVSSALVGGVAAEATSALFTEVGVDATVDATQVAATESPEMKILRERYKTDAK